MNLRATPALQARGTFSRAVNRLARLWPRALATVLISLVIAYAITRTPPIIAAAAVLGLVVGFLFLRKPVWGAYALILSVSVQKAVSYDAGPIEITVTQVLF